MHNSHEIKGAAPTPPAPEATPSAAPEPICTSCGQIAAACKCSKAERLNANREAILDAVFAPLGKPPAPTPAPVLKPCPFCGEWPETDLLRGYMRFSGKLGKAVAIYCPKCPADFTLCHEDYPGDPPEYLLSVLAECWNRRTTPTPAPDAQTTEQVRENS